MVWVVTRERVSGCMCFADLVKVVAVFDNEELAKKACDDINALLRDTIYYYAPFELNTFNG